MGQAPGGLRHVEPPAARGGGRAPSCPPRRRRGARGLPHSVGADGGRAWFGAGPALASWAVPRAGRPVVEAPSPRGCPPALPGPSPAPPRLGLALRAGPSPRDTLPGLLLVAVLTPARPPHFAGSLARAEASPGAPPHTFAARRLSVPLGECPGTDSVQSGRPWRSTQCRQRGEPHGAACSQGLASPRQAPGLRTWSGWRARPGRGGLGAHPVGPLCPRVARLVASTSHGSKTPGRQCHVVADVTAQ